LPKEAMTALPIKGEITVKNTSQNLLPPQALSISSTDLFPNEQTIYSPAIPPFGWANVNTSFQPEPFLTNKISQFTIRVNDQTVTHSIDISPLLIKKWWMVGGGIAIAIFGIILLITAFKSRRLQISRRR
jgi:hypothetical protein